MDIILNQSWSRCKAIKTSSWYSTEYDPQLIDLGPFCPHNHWPSPHLSWLNSLLEFVNPSGFAGQPASLAVKIIFPAKLIISHYSISGSTSQIWTWQKVWNPHVCIVFLLEITSFVWLSMIQQQFFWARAVGPKPSAVQNWEKSRCQPPCVAHGAVARWEPVERRATSSNCGWDQKKTWESLPRSCPFGMRINKDDRGFKYTLLICPIYLALSGHIRYSQNHISLSSSPPKKDHQWIGFREKNRGTSYIYQKTIGKNKLVFG